MNKNNYSKLGKSTNYVWNNDPKRLGITLARYKFVSKMVSLNDSILEIGCGDSFQNRVVKQSCKSLTAIDINKELIIEADYNKSKNYPVKHILHDIISKPISNKKNLFDGVFSLDVFEHIEKKKSKKFILNCKKSLKKTGCLIIGIPSLESQKYASKMSKEGHVNCLSGDEFKRLMKKHFNNVFLFSMNDEVVHTGFYKMSNYLFAVCTGKK